MKIAIGFNDIRPDGQGSAAVTLMRELKRQGVDVLPIHAWKHIELPGYIEEFKPLFIHPEDEEVPVERIIEKMVDTINGDSEITVFTHFGQPNWACVTPYLRKDIKVVVSVHSISPSAIKIAMAHHQRVDAFVAVSWMVEKKLRKVLPRRERYKVNLILNALDLTKYEKAQHIPSCNDKLKIVFFGRIEDVTKGCDKIPQIAKLLKKRGIVFQWDLYGYFHWGYECLFNKQLRENGVSESVCYRGCLMPEEVPSVLAKYDIMVMPSNHEGFGLALIEAMAVGVPPVASKLKNVTEKILYSPSLGFLSAKNSIKQFADNISKLATDFELRKEISFNARKEVFAKYSSESQGQSYIKLFDRLEHNSEEHEVLSLTHGKFVRPNAVKPHIMARLLPLSVKKVLKKYL